METSDHCEQQQHPLLGRDILSNIINLLGVLEWSSLRCCSKAMHDQVGLTLLSCVSLDINELGGTDAAPEDVAHALSRIVSITPNLRSVSFFPLPRDGKALSAQEKESLTGIVLGVGYSNAWLYVSSSLLYSLTRLNHLQHLNLQGLTVYSRGLHALERSLPFLESLDVSRVTVTCMPEIDYYGGARGLLGSIFGWNTRASIAGAHAAATGEAEQAPVFASRLKKLGFVGTNLARRWRLAWFSCLEEFEGRFPDCDAIVPLSSCTRLRSLTLFGTRICELRVQTIAWTKVLSRLTYLALKECDLRPRPHLLFEPWETLDFVLDSAPLLINLSLHDISGPPISGTYVCALARGMARTNTSSAEGHISTWKGHALESIEINGTDDVGAYTIKALAEALGPRLRRLVLRGNLPLFDDACMRALAAACPRLHTLIVPFSMGVTDAGLRALALGSCGPLLQELDFTRCQVLCASTLSLLHDRCPRLSKVRLWGCHACVLDIDEGHRSGKASRRSGASILQSWRNASVRVEYSPCTIYGTIAAQERGQLHSTCAETMTLCTHGCGARMSLLDADDHSTLCPSAKRPCTLAAYGCKEVLPAAQLGAHLLQCTAYTVQCLFCPAVVLMSGLHAHVDAHVRCRLQASLRVRCPMALDGCPYVQSVHCAPSPSSSSTAHFACGQCPVAAYLCRSCCTPLPLGASRDSLCWEAQGHAPGTPPARACYLHGLRRCRMPHMVHMNEAERASSSGAGGTGDERGGDDSRGHGPPNCLVRDLPLDEVQAAFPAFGPRPSILPSCSSTGVDVGAASAAGGLSESHCSLVAVSVGRDLIAPAGTPRAAPVGRSGFLQVWEEYDN